MFLYESSLRGLTAVALDGVLGKVHGILFDDVNWMVRHIAIRRSVRPWGDTKVIAPARLTLPDWHLRTVAVQLRRNQVENERDFNAAVPVSQQGKIELHHHQGFILGIPYDAFGAALMVPTATAEKDLATSAKSSLAGCDPHLRSSRAVRGYQVQLCSGETLGLAEDFVIDTARWTITQIVIRMHTRFHRRRLLIPSKIVEGISWRERTIATRLPPYGAASRFPAYTVQSKGPTYIRGGRPMRPVGRR